MPEPHCHGGSVTLCSPPRTSVIAANKDSSAWEVGTAVLQPATAWELGPLPVRVSGEGGAGAARSRP
eukprot:699466-Pyramimonas_sp.AAC.1